MFGNDRGLEKRLRKGAGKTARAILVDAKKGHWVSSTGGSESQLANSAKVTWTLTLRVMPDGEPPFEAMVKEGFRVGSRPSPNYEYKVLYDPRDHSKVAIDHTPMTDAERAEQRRRAAENARAQGRAAVVFPSAAASAASHPATSTADELEKLAALRDRGVLTEQEFETQKRKILDL
jgi:hypothetical protein